jgi:hypothetical protein
MSAGHEIVNRSLVGALAAACCGVGAALWFGWPDQEAFAAGCLRVGLLLGAVWLALPTKTRPAAWASISPAVVVVVVLALLLVRQLRVFIPLLVVVTLAALVLRPRSKSPRRRGTSGR